MSSCCAAGCSRNFHSPRIASPYQFVATRRELEVESAKQDSSEKHCSNIAKARTAGGRCFNGPKPSMALGWDNATPVR